MNLLAYALLASIFAQVAGAGEDAAATELSRQTCRIGEPPLELQIVEREVEFTGASRSWSERFVVIEGGGPSPIELEAERVTARCERDVVRLTRTDGERVPVTVRLIRSGDALVVDPGLKARLDRAWAHGAREDLSELARLLEALPAPVRPTPALLLTARLVAARQALKADDFRTTESMLEGTEALAPGSTWGKRRDALKRALVRARARTQPLVASRPVRLGTKQLAPTFPPQPYTDVFWQGAKVCVAQEDATPPTRMRCFDVSTKRWGGVEPLQIPTAVPGALRETGDGNVCDYVRTCWHTGLSFSGASCEGLPCAQILAAVPGPELIVREAQGLVALSAIDAARPLADGVSPQLLSGLPGSVLAGGHLFFEGPVLLDAHRPALSWRPFDGVVEDATAALVSPDLQWAVVAAGEKPVTLWLVELRRRP